MTAKFMGMPLLLFLLYKYYRPESVFSSLFICRVYLSPLLIFYFKNCLASVCIPYIRCF